MINKFDNWINESAKTETSFNSVESWLKANKIKYEIISTDQFRMTGTGDKRFAPYSIEDSKYSAIITSDKMKQALKMGFASMYWLKNAMIADIESTPQEFKPKWEIDRIFNNIWINNDSIFLRPYTITDNKPAETGYEDGIRKYLSDYFKGYELSFQSINTWSSSYHVHILSVSMKISNFIKFCKNFSDTIEDKFIIDTLETIAWQDNVSNDSTYNSQQKENIQNSLKVTLTNTKFAKEFGLFKNFALVKNPKFIIGADLCGMLSDEDREKVKNDPSIWKKLDGDTLRHIYKNKNLISPDTYKTFRGKVGASRFGI